MTEPPDGVLASYYRCRREGGFIDTFYEVFLSKSPAVAAKFEQTDFKIQKLMLRQSLLEMLCFDRGLAGTSEEIARLAARHRELEISEEMYGMWLDSLCTAVERHDPEYCAELEQLWRRAMLKSIAEMVAAST